MHLQELDEALHDAGVDHLLDGRVLLCGTDRQSRGGVRCQYCEEEANRIEGILTNGQKSSEVLGRVQLLGGVFGEHVLAVLQDLLGSGLRHLHHGVSGSVSTHARTILINHLINLKKSVKYTNNTPVMKLTALRF